MHLYPEYLQTDTYAELKAHFLSKLDDNLFSGTYDYEKITNN